jgi:hypothetical protein
MRKLRLAGIRRGSEFSPNHTGNDAAIFELVTSKLLSKGCTIIEYTEAGFLGKDIPEKMIYGMARDKQTVEKMKSLESDGYCCINSGVGIENCYRNNMTILLLEKGIPYPKSEIVSTQRDATDAFNRLESDKLWIKRGDFHAMHKEDVSFCSSIEEGNSLLREFAFRGIESATVSVHLFGDLVKFYGVRNTNFFYWFYPYDFSYSKFGNESVNGENHKYSFQEEMLKFVGNQAAEILGIYIYGGDAIISSEGFIQIIDLNDWPSFAPCREEASEAIAQCIYDTFSAD